MDEVWLAKSESSVESGTYVGTPILGEGDFDLIEFNQHGGIFHLISNPEIQPYGVIILQLHKLSP